MFSCRNGDKSIDVAAYFIGQGTPQSLPFEVYDPGFVVVGRGTATAIPEPSSFICLGLVALGFVGSGMIFYGVATKLFLKSTRK